MELLARDQLENTEDAQLQAAVSALVRQGAAVAEIPGTQNAQGTDAIPEEGATQDTSSTSAASAPVPARGSKQFPSSTAG